MSDEKEEFTVDYFILPNLSGKIKGEPDYNKILAIRSKIKKNALALCVTTIIENKEHCGPEVLAAANCLIPHRSSSGVNTEKARVLNSIKEIFQNREDEVHEDDIYKEFHIARPGMKDIIRDIIRKEKNPQKTKWISFDPVKGFYRLIKIGEKEPEGWAGYRPIVKF